MLKKLKYYYNNENENIKIVENILQYLNMELNNKIQMIRNDKAQKDKTIETVQNKIKDLNKQLETKDVTINEMNKKNDELKQFLKDKKEYNYLENDKYLEADDPFFYSTLGMTDLKNRLNMEDFLIHLS